MGDTEDKGGGDVQDTIHINPFDPDSIDEAIKAVSYTHLYRASSCFADRDAKPHI